MLTRDSIRLTFALGVALSLPGTLYLVALKDIATADQTKLDDLLQILVYNLIMFVFAEIPLIGYAIAPDQTREAVTRFRDWLGGHARELAMALCGAAAAYLLTRGLLGLL